MDTTRRPHPRARGAALAALTAIAVTGPAWAQTPAPGAAAASIDVAEGDREARYGERFAIEGELPGMAQGAPVYLQHREPGGSYRRVQTTETRAGGRYRFAVTARRSGSYRALGDQVAPSSERRVRVAGKVRARSARHVLPGDELKVRGRVLPATAGRPLRLQRATGEGWRTVDRTRSGRGGRFHASWTPTGPGTHRLRVRAGGDRLAASGVDRLRSTSYRAGFASWYGPGLYGNKLGCGGTLTPSTVGVAHKTLPCGTKVTFRYGSRSVTAPVVDRGPYVGGREWDLTSALKQRLGFPSTGTVYTNR